MDRVYIEGQTYNARSDYARVDGEENVKCAFSSRVQLHVHMWRTYVRQPRPWECEMRGVSGRISRAYAQLATNSNDNHAMHSQWDASRGQQLEMMAH